jgi:hypothetical protein
MPSFSRTMLDPPSQPARKSQRTCSVWPVSTTRRVQVTPSPSGTKSSKATPQRASTSGSSMMASRSTGSIITWLTRMAGSRGCVPSFRARISARFSTTLG